MSIAQSIPVTDLLRELDERGAAEVFELPQLDASEPTAGSKRPWVLVGAGVTVAIVVVATLALLPRFDEAPDQPASAGAMPLTAEALPVAPSGEAQWRRFEDRFKKLNTSPAKAPVPPASAPVAAIADSGVIAAKAAAGAPADGAPAAGIPATGVPASDVAAKAIESPEVSGPIKRDPAPVTASESRVTAIHISELESRMLGDVRRMLFQGNRRGARSTLLEFMQTHGETAETKTLLGSLLLREGRVREANALIADVTALTPSPKLRLLKARLLIAVGQGENAIRILEAHVPPVDQMTDYHSLLGLLYQQSGQYEAAAGIYGNLVRFDETNASFHLGHAISLDGAGHHGAAIDAYEASLADGRLPREAGAYALSRLRDLSYRR